MAAPAVTLTLGSLGVPTQAHKAFTLQPTSRFLRPSFPSLFIGPNASPLAPSKSYTTPTRGASFKTAVASIESDQLSSSDPANMQEQGSGKYYFVVANAKFMLDEEEHFKELLFERLRYYGERSKEQDFWLVIEPKFLDKFPNITKRLRRPAVALVSTNGPWITLFETFTCHLPMRFNNKPGMLLWYNIYDFAVPLALYHALPSMKWAQNEPINIFLCKISCQQSIFSQQRGLQPLGKHQ